eukprot:scaffold5857_cov74-Skeletonema_dohrnii-CCMP3373.AAC.2
MKEAGALHTNNLYFKVTCPIYRFYQALAQVGFVTHFCAHSESSLRFTLYRHTLPAQPQKRRQHPGQHRRGQGSTPIYYSSYAIIMMAEAEEDDEMIFVYMGGDQVVPDDVRRVRIDKSVTIIPRDAFRGRQRLICVEFHEGIERIERAAFNCCFSLRSVKLMGVKVIEGEVFDFCCGLTDVEFGDMLETIGSHAFYSCTSLRSIIMPSVKTIGRYAFDNCQQLTDLDLPEGLETVSQGAFDFCQRLRRITIPLNCVIDADVFSDCPDLTTVDLVGGIHNTIASLHLETWKNDTKQEINRINQVLPNTTSSQKTAEIQEWMRSVIHRINHYKAEHKALLKEATTLLELALWKANLHDNEGGVIEQEGVRTTRGRRKRARKEICVTSGATTGLLLYANYEGATEEGKRKEICITSGMIEQNNCTVNPVGGEVQRVMYILHKFSCPGEENKMNR